MKRALTPTCPSNSNKEVKKEEQNPSKQYAGHLTPLPPLKVRRQTNDPVTPTPQHRAYTINLYVAEGDTVGPSSFSACIHPMPFLRSSLSEDSFMTSLQQVFMNEMKISADEFVTFTKKHLPLHKPVMMPLSVLNPKPIMMCPSVLVATVATMCANDADHGTAWVRASVGERETCTMTMAYCPAIHFKLPKAWSGEVGLMSMKVEAKHDESMPIIDLNQ